MLVFKIFKLTVNFEITDSNYCFQTYCHSALDCELFHITAYSALIDWLKNTYGISLRAKFCARSWRCNIEQESPYLQDAYTLAKDDTTEKQTDTKGRGC